MIRTARYDSLLRRFVLNVTSQDEVMFDVKRIEGRRWHKALKYWSTPASLRAWDKLEQLGFTMLQHGGGREYLDWGNTGFSVEGLSKRDETLFPFQQDGVARLKYRSHVLLADEPGLGKTIQAIEWASSSDRPTLVIAPKVILYNWVSEIANREGHVVDVREVAWRTGWNIVNPEFLPKLAMPMNDFDLIIDEAHLFTNMKARRTKLAIALAERAKRVLLLTGTPPSRPLRLWPFYVMLKEREPKEFFPFALRYCGAEQNDFGWNFNGVTHVDELKLDMQHFTLRRTKEEVLNDLPEKLYTTVVAEETKVTTRGLSLLDGELQSMVARGWQLTSGVGLGAIQRLRVATSKAKVETTAALVASRLPAKHLVFCEFRETMDALMERIVSLAEDPEMEVAQLHGDTTHREAVEGWFREGAGRVLLCQYQVAGLGLNLQSASTVVIHDLPWTPAQLEQAIDRAHRIGQRDSVHVITVLSQSRVEARMLEGLRAGQQLSEALYNSA